MNLKPDLNPLVDGDIIVYRCGFAADSQAKKEFGDDKYLERDYLAWALSNVKTIMEELLEQAFPDHQYYKAYLTGKGNFRENLATIKKYKGNRDPSHRPKYYSEIKEYLVQRWNAEVIEGQEADDALGIHQWANKDKSTVIVSIDKDLNQIPGYHYNWVKGDFYYVTIDEANLWFFKQMLIGDTTDNIPGIDKIGPKTTDKLLPDGTSVQDAQAVVQGLYKKQYGDAWLGPYTEVANLLWMRRTEGQVCPF